MQIFFLTVVVAIFLILVIVVWDVQRVKIFISQLYQSFSLLFVLCIERSVPSQAYKNTNLHCFIYLSLVHFFALNFSSLWSVVWCMALTLFSSKWLARYPNIIYYVNHPFSSHWICCLDSYFLLTFGSFHGFFFFDWLFLSQI